MLYESPHFRKAPADVPNGALPYVVAGEDASRMEAQYCRAFAGRQHVCLEKRRVAILMLKNTLFAYFEGPAVSVCPHATSVFEGSGGLANFFQ